MTTALDLALPDLRRAIARPLAFVWKAWRGLSRRHFAYALLIGLGVGIAFGGGSILAMRGVWWRSLLSEVLDFAFVAPILLLCLAVAAQVRTTRMPKWLPYVVAAAAAVAIDYLLGYVKCCMVLRPLLTFFGDDPSAWPGANMQPLEGLWLHLPRMFELCLLTALGYMYFRESRMRADALRNVQLERVRVARLTYEARLQTMQARVEPQFLFDTLSDVEALYESIPETAEQVLDNLIVYLRAALPSLREASSTLATELKLAQAWLDIMQTRLHGQLSYAISTPDFAKGTRMPPMLLLPLIDQAVRGRQGTSRSGGAIEVESALADKRLRITISHSGDAFSPGVPNPATTLVRERISALYGMEAALSTRIAESEASQAVLEIPHEHAERDHR